MTALIDTGATGHGFIDEESARVLMDRLQIEAVRLLKPKPLKGFDGKPTRPITHAIYPQMAIQGHTESTTPLLITRLGQHQIILGTPWMQRHGVLLDMGKRTLSFTPGSCAHVKARTILRSDKVPNSKEATTPISVATNEVKMKSTPPPHEFGIIGAAPFYGLARDRQQRVFRTSLLEINNLIQSRQTSRSMNETTAEVLSEFNFVIQYQTGWIYYQ